MYINILMWRSLGPFVALLPKMLMGEFMPRQRQSSVLTVVLSCCFSLHAYAQATRVSLLSSLDLPDNGTAVAFSSDNKKLAGGTSGQVLIWDNTSRLIQTLKIKSAVEEETEGGLFATVRRKNWVTRIVFSPNGSRIAVVANYANPSIYEVETGKLLFSLPDHRNGTSCLAYSPDGKVIATGGRDRSAALWDADTGKLKYALSDYSFNLRDVAFSTDGKRLITLALEHRGQQNTQVRVWNVDDGKEFSSGYLTNTQPRLTALSPTGETVVIQGADGGHLAIQAWSVNTMSLQRSTLDLVFRDFPDPVITAFSNDGRYCALMRTRSVPLGSGAASIGARSRETIIWDIAANTYALKHPPDSPRALRPYAATAMAMTNDTRIMAFACANRKIEIWGIEN